MLSSAYPRPSLNWLTRWEYAHRGLHSAGAPENSLGAADAAIKAGLGIECDVQRSFDNHPMVFHDWELERLTDASSQTSDHTRIELEGLTLTGVNETVPSLEAFLKRVAGSVPLLIEIKSRPDYDIEPSCSGVAKELKAYSGHYAVMSFDPRVAAWFRRNSAQTVCGLVMREDQYGHTQTLEEREAALVEAEPDFLAYHVSALPNPWVEELRSGGLRVLTWTVNSLVAREKALIHADALISEGEGLP
jgi:glycerophosphoryl diester phosphodiesterase